MLSKWLEIGVGVGINGLLIFVILDDSVLNVSNSTFSILVAFSLLAAVNLWYIFKSRSPVEDDKSTAPEESSDQHSSVESYIESPSE
jgi:hypothetical protein